MSLPEGWEWLDDLPDWSPPEELRGPANSLAVNLAIAILSCDVVSNDVCARVGKFVTAYALFNVWFLNDAKGSGRDARELAEVSVVGTEQTRLVYQAWSGFRTAMSAEGSNEEVRQLIRAREGRLSAALDAAIAALGAVRTGTF